MWWSLRALSLHICSPSSSSCCSLTRFLVFPALQTLSCIRTLHWLFPPPPECHTGPCVTPVFLLILPASAYVSSSLRGIPSAPPSGPFRCCILMTLSHESPAQMSPSHFLFRIKLKFLIMGYTVQRSDFIFCIPTYTLLSIQTMPVLLPEPLRFQGFSKSSLGSLLRCICASFPTILSKILPLTTF